MPQRVKVARLPIKLTAFLKLAGAVATGGEARLLIDDRCVSVNGQLETRRGRQLLAGDVAAVDARGQWQVMALPAADNGRHAR